ncbi:MAG: HupE/UreJ family protein [Burkholderiales bacterium]
MRLSLALAMPASFALFAALLLCPGESIAHNTRLSSSQLSIKGSSATGVLEVNSLDLEVALSIKLNTPEGKVSPEMAAANQTRVFEYLLAKAGPTQTGGQRCKGTGESLTAKGDHVLATLRWACDAGPPVDFETTLFQEIDPAARHMVTASGDARAFALLGASNTTVRLARTEPALGEVLWRYFLAGVEHIAIGYDHIAFLIAVILWGRKFWPLAAVVTAFTVAHSITLSLAVLGVVQPPSQLVETMIALSIVYVAAENFFVRDIGRRWIVTFLFGLIHGFGFASVLREYGIPQERIGWALASFNVGVEAGQLVIVALAFAAIFLTGRVWKDAALDSVHRKRFVWSVSAIILALGIYWAVDRIFFS